MGASGSPGARAHSFSRLELWVPALYGAVAAAWIVLFDRFLAGAGSAGQQSGWQTLTGFGFVAVTAASLHTGLRWALRREREAYHRVITSEATPHAVSDAIPGPVFLKHCKSNSMLANLAALNSLGISARDIIECKQL